MRIFTAASLLLLASASFSSQANSEKGDWFVHASALSSFYQYEEDDARAELPESIVQLLDADDFRGDDSDYLNVSLGLGYYISNDLNISLTYTDDIELNFLSGLDVGFLFNDVDNERLQSDGELKMLELDAQYKAYQFTPSLAFTLKGGLVYNKLDIQVSRFQDSNFTTILNDSQSKVGVKLGLGLQWDFSDNWALKGGYSHLSFLSMDKVYLQLEYRF
ncbi:outer membrane beta-barrel protein [Glaciecola sp. MH2013]|uniref:outer membrane protein n=1 Tax=Glaciecola sp. MH2013 TaxID=2785524 RepID=UPI00189DA572|nr:outer membrane beta-barrel protein [Glaciecola sp. MH2013]MBF7074276.1 outer membrane beta-barrel protein [Glaciecola sp. MH2013]